MAETLNQYKSNLTPEEVDQALHNIAQLDDGIAQAKQYAEQAQGYAESINPGNFYTKEETDAAFAPTSHANAETTYGAATGSLYGHVMLADTASASGASAGVAATPKCVQAAVSASLLSPTWENDFTDDGATRVWRIGDLVVCQFNIKIPTISRGAWVGILTIPGVNPGINVNGRMPTVVAGEARDYFISTDGELRAYLNVDDSGHTYNLPLVFVSVE